MKDGLRNSMHEIFSFHDAVKPDFFFASTLSTIPSTALNQSRGYKAAQVHLNIMKRGILMIAILSLLVTKIQEKNEF